MLVVDRQRLPDFTEIDWRERDCFDPFAVLWRAATVERARHRKLDLLEEPSGADPDQRLASLQRSDLGIYARRRFLAVTTKPVTVGCAVQRAGDLHADERVRLTAHRGVDLGWPL